MSQTGVLSRVPALDGVRGIAAIAVVTAHCVFVTHSDVSAVADRIFTTTVRIIGPFGVDLFFVLSGYLITAILDRTRESTRPYFFFYARRFFRIVPLYFVYLIVVPAVLPAPGMSGTASSRIWEWLFLTNFAMATVPLEQMGAMFSHLWSLAIEEQFYIVWPIVILATPASRLARVCALLIVFSFVARTILVAMGMATHGWLLMPSRLDGLAAGSLVALLQRRDPAMLSRWAKTLTIPAAVSAAFLVTVLVASFWNTDATPLGMFDPLLPGRRLEVVFSPLAGAVVFACVVARLTENPATNRPPLLTAGWLGSVGRASYGMYLFHPLVILGLLVAGLPRQPRLGDLDLPYQMAFTVLVIVISHGIGVLTLNAFEKHWLKLAPQYRYAVRKGGPLDLPRRGAGGVGAE
jgi:peptidoglycan/LPS O-acetylase OafA/YrhL